jgi:hypothetical protein
MTGGITAGVAERLRLTVLAAYDRTHGMELEHSVVDGCSTKAPCGGQTAEPAQAGAQALGIPLGRVPAPANRHDDGLLAAALDSIGVVGVLPQRPVVHLDAGDD